MSGVPGAAAMPANLPLPSRNAIASQYEEAAAQGVVGSRHADGESPQAKRPRMASPQPVVRAIPIIRALVYRLSCEF